MHHEFGHLGLRVAGRGEIEVADDGVGGAAGHRSANQQVLGAVVPELAQHLLADGRHRIEFGCRTDEFAHLELLLRIQRAAPVSRGH